MTLHRRTFLGAAFGVAATSLLPRTAFGQAQPAFPLYDTHAHFFSNDTAHYPFKSGAPQNVAERIMARAMANPMTPDVVFKMWDECGVAMGCGVQYNSTYSTDNSYLLDITRTHPDRIVGIVILNPTDGATPGTLETMAHENRIAGVRFTGPADSAGEYVFLSPAAAPSWEAANRLGLVIVLMPVGQPTAPAMARVAEHARRYPRVRIVLDHIGFPQPLTSPSFGLSPEHVALAKYPNVYYKYTTLLIEQLHAAKVPAGPFLKHVVKIYGADKMVWGTDVGNTQGAMSDFVHHALDSAKGLSLRQQRAIFHDTAKRIFVPGGTRG